MLLVMIVQRKGLLLLAELVENVSMTGWLTSWCEEQAMSYQLNVSMCRRDDWSMYTCVMTTLSSGICEPVFGQCR